MIDRIDGIARAGASGAPGDERERSRRQAASRAASAPLEEIAVATGRGPALQPVASFLAEVARLAVSDDPALPADADGTALRMRHAAAQAIGAQARLAAAGVHALLSEPPGGVAGSR